MAGEKRMTTRRKATGTQEPQARTTARRSTRRIAKAAEPAPEAAPPPPAESFAPPPAESFTSASTSEPASSSRDPVTGPDRETFEGPGATAAFQRAVAAPPSEWIPIVYEGRGVFVDRDAGVFTTGLRTRLRAPLASRLLGFEGFRQAA